MKSRTGRASSKSDDDTKSKPATKSDKEDRKKSSALRRVGKPIQSFWKKYLNLIKNLLKLLLVSSVLLGGILFLVQHGADLLPPREGIV